MNEVAQSVPDRELLTRYGCGPIRFSGHRRRPLRAAPAVRQRRRPDDCRHARESFEAFARSVRDILSQRWVRTEKTYERENPKRVYYLSMEFLIGRSLANNVTNLLLDPVVQASRRARRSIDWLELARAGAGRGPGQRRARAAWRPASSTRWPRCSFRPWATACATNTACSSRRFEDGWQHEQPDNWLRAPDPWEVARPHEKVEVKLNCSFEVRGGSLQRDSGPAVQPDRHSVRPARRGLRRQDDQHAAALGRGGARLLRFSGIQQRRFRRRAGRDARRPNRSPACCIPTTPRAWARDCASCRSIFWSPARWPTWCGASGATMPTGARFPRRSPSSSTTRTRRWRSPS